MKPESISFFFFKHWPEILSLTKIPISSIFFPLPGANEWKVLPSEGSGEKIGERGCTLLRRKTLHWPQMQKESCRCPFTFSSMLSTPICCIFYSISKKKDKKRKNKEGLAPLAGRLRALPAFQGASVDSLLTCGSLPSPCRYPFLFPFHLADSYSLLMSF